MDLGAPAVALHVALHGDDEQSGDRDRPFCSLARAQRAVRELRARGHEGPVRVVLHDGFYELDAALEGCDLETDPACRVLDGWRAREQLWVDWVGGEMDRLTDPEEQLDAFRDAVEEALR